MSATTQSLRSQAQFRLIQTSYKLHEAAGDSMSASERVQFADQLEQQGATPHAFTFRRTLEFAQVANEEIETASKLRPEMEVRYNQAMPALCWHARVLPMPVEKVYRAHVRELLDRVMSGRSIQPGTQAEVLMYLVAASLEAPLNQCCLLAMEKTYSRIMEDDSHEYRIKELQPGMSDALIANLVVHLGWERPVRK